MMNNAVAAMVAAAANNANLFCSLAPCGRLNRAQGARLRTYQSRFGHLLDYNDLINFQETDMTQLTKTSPSQKTSGCCAPSGTKQDDVREAVREHYAERARTSTSCCGSNTLYDESLISNVPAEISDFTLGCGDPITMANLKEGETVLDLGSGGGLDCFLAAQRVGASGKVIGVDMTAEMLAKARANAAKMNATNVEFREGYLEALPVEDSSVDVVISNCVINLSPDKPQVFREVYRALKPGGRISVSDIVTNGEMNPLVAKGMEAWAACVAGALDMKEYVSGLTDAGFTDVRVQPKDKTQDLLSALPVGVPFSATITATKPSA
jgi:SAM-dependent methyltransferase